MLAHVVSAGAAEATFETKDLGPLLAGGLMELQLTRAVLSIAGADASGRAGREAQNVVERWLLAAVQPAAAQPLAAPPLAAQPAAAQPAGIYSRIDLSASAPANKKMVAELSELANNDKQLHRAPSARGRGGHVKHSGHAKHGGRNTHANVAAPDVFAAIVAAVEAARPAIAAAFAGRGAPAVAHCGGTLRCAMRAPSAPGAAAAGATTPTIEFEQPIDAATETLVRIGSCAAAAAVAVRYAALAPAGQQWGLPRAHVDFLYREWGVLTEAFASPLNSRLLGLPGACFCSLFLDTDAVFGSAGDFFACDALPGAWVVNPPFVEALLTAAAHKCLAALAGPSPPPAVFFVGPDWRDAEFHRLLSASALCAAKLTLEPGNYYYESPDGARVPTRARSAYFALASAQAGSRDFAAALQNITDV